MDSPVRDKSFRTHREVRKGGFYFTNYRFSPVSKREQKLAQIGLSPLSKPVRQRQRKSNTHVKSRLRKRIVEKFSAESLHPSGKCCKASIEDPFNVECYNVAKKKKFDLKATQELSHSSSEPEICDLPWPRGVML